MRSVNLTAGLPPHTPLAGLLATQAAISFTQYQSARANLSTELLNEEAHRRFASAVESWRQAVATKMSLRAPQAARPSADASPTLTTRENDMTDTASAVALRRPARQRLQGCRQAPS